MNIVLLSGGSGQRLWPLSNEIRSKQFIKIFHKEDGELESMVQRVYRQIRTVDTDATVTIATSKSQVSAIHNQLGENVGISVEPCRRDTFPAIALAAAYLKDVQHIGEEEAVVICPVDPYVEDDYFKTIEALGNRAAESEANLVLMGIEPTYPSEKYGYIIPKSKENISEVSMFKEKPTAEVAEGYISQGALWNGGVFAFRLGYVLKRAHELIDFKNYDDLFAKYNTLKKISFDYAVVEHEPLIEVMRFSGTWKDLGTWNTLTDELSEHTMGNVVMDEESENTHVINELGLPIMCIGTRNLVIAASNDGILISDKDKSENIKTYADCLQHRPMFEERRWGEYKVVDTAEFSDGYKSLTKQLKIKSGKSISYQVHRHRDEVWTFIDGEGELVLDDIRSVISRGDTITIKKGVKHAVRAISELTFIEVQSGNLLAEEDIEQFDYKW